ncbi:hypothetical protein HG531_001168 [Fusarium graminearum]|nr:hypothetical protein HG531_001168 [Fusarium graminearum]
MGIATNGIRQKKRSETLAKQMAEMAAATYGGAEPRRKSQEARIHTVRERRLAQEKVCLDIDTPVGKDHLDILPSNSVLLLEAATLLDKHGELEELDLFRCKPSRRKGRGVDKEKEACDTEKDCDHALEEEDPSPTLKTGNTVHLSDTSSKETGESA